MTNSPLVTYTQISPNSTNPRNRPITKITIHHVAGNLSLRVLGDIFARKARRASSNYGIDSRGNIGMYVEEKNRAWTSGNAENDHQAITIEISNNGGAPNWPVSDAAYEAAIKLAVDICKRNNIKELKYTGDSKGTLTTHNMFQATQCPGPYLKKRMPAFAEEVTKRLNPPAPKPQPKPEVGDIYVVQKDDTLWAISRKFKVSVDDLVKWNNIKNRDRIFEGQKLRVSDKSYRVHVVKRGDTLWGLAESYLGNGRRHGEIKELNKLDSDTILPEQELLIPNK